MTDEQARVQDKLQGMATGGLAPPLCGRPEGFGVVQARLNFNGLHPAIALLAFASEFDDSTDSSTCGSKHVHTMFQYRVIPVGMRDETGLYNTGISSVIDSFSHQQTPRRRMSSSKSNSIAAGTMLSATAGH